MAERKTKQVGFRVSEQTYEVIEQLGNQCDRTVAGMARFLCHERIAQIAAECNPDATAASVGGTGTAAT